MSHCRDLIETCIKNALHGKTIAKGKVYTVSEAVFSQNYPMIILFCPVETVNHVLKEEALPERTLELDITGVVKNNANLVVDIHNLAKEIEISLKPDQLEKHKIIKNIMLKKSEVDVLSESEGLIGFVRLTYCIDYQEAKPEVDELEDNAVTRAFEPFF